MNKTKQTPNGRSASGVIPLLVAALVIALLLEAQFAGRIHPALQVLWAWLPPVASSKDTVASAPGDVNDSPVDPTRAVAGDAHATGGKVAGQNGPPPPALLPPDEAWLAEWIEMLCEGNAGSWAVLDAHLTDRAELDATTVAVLLQVVQHGRRAKTRQRAAAGLLRTDPVALLGTVYELERQAALLRGSPGEVLKIVHGRQYRDLLLDNLRMWLSSQPEDKARTAVAALADMGSDWEELRREDRLVRLGLARKFVAATLRERYEGDEIAGLAESIRKVEPKFAHVFAVLASPSAMRMNGRVVTGGFSTPEPDVLTTMFLEPRIVRNFDEKATRLLFDDVRSKYRTDAIVKTLVIPSTSARESVKTRLNKWIDKQISANEWFDQQLSAHSIQRELYQEGLDLAAVPILIDAMKSDAAIERREIASQVLVDLGPMAGLALAIELEASSPAIDPRWTVAAITLDDPWRSVVLLGVRSEAARQQQLLQTFESWLRAHTHDRWADAALAVRHMDYWSPKDRATLLEIAKSSLVEMLVNDTDHRAKELLQVAATIDQTLAQQMTSNASSRFRARVMPLLEQSPSIADQRDQLLLDSLDDKSPAVRRAAAFEAAMLGLKAHSATPQLMGLLDDEAPAVRREAAYALRVMLTASDAMLGIEEPARKRLPDLIAALGDRDPDVVEAAAWSLEQLGPDAANALPALRKRLETPDMHLRQRIKAAISAIQAK